MDRTVHFFWYVNWAVYGPYTPYIACTLDDIWTVQKFSYGPFIVWIIGIISTMEPTGKQSLFRGHSRSHQGIGELRSQQLILPKAIEAMDFI